VKKERIKIGFAALYSVLAGLIIIWILSGTFKLSLTDYLLNAGYSLAIGMSLFANGYLFGLFEKRYISWIKFPARSLALAISLHLAYSSFVIFFVNWVWFILIGSNTWEQFWNYGKEIIISEYIVFVIIASIIYAISFFKDWKRAVQEAEKMKLEALSLKYQVLQNQVNPHFLFNSLNVLGSLIDIDIEKAKIFNRELSMFYRDVLRFKDLELIALEEEIDFMKKYIYLQEIRFGQALEVDFMIAGKVKGMVIPLSLQMLVENAIKHNEISSASPLRIYIAVTDDFELIVENNLQPKKRVEPGSHTGLKNLAGRYEFLTGKKVAITDENHYFRVILPLIKMDGD